MSSNLFFSIIMPVYNVEDYLKQSINSVLTQSFVDYELILVDDGSTDSSGNICDNFSKTDKRIVVIHKENGGLSDARNQGTLKAVGKYLIYIDSDDFWDDCLALEKLKLIIDKNNPDVVTWRYKKYFDDINQYSESVGYDYVFDVFDAKKIIDSQNYGVSACCKTVKRDFIIDNNLFFEDKELSEDIEWSAKILALTQNISVSNLDFYVYCQRKGSISHSISDKSINDLKKHITSIVLMIKNASGNCKKILSYYLAQEFTNLVVTMSSYKNYSEEINWIKQNKHILNYSCTRRSKILKIMINLLGVKLSIKVIGRLRKI